jgi:hypothetical protein
LCSDESETGPMYLYVNLYVRETIVCISVRHLFVCD